MQKQNEHGFVHIVLALVLAGLVGGTVTAVVANSARPGDMLYGLDATMENVRLALTFGEQAKAEQYAAMAQERYGEVNSLINGNADQDKLDQAIRKYGDQMNEALSRADQLDESAKQQVLGIVAENALLQQDELSGMLGVAPEQVQAMVQSALQTAEQYQQRAFSGLSEENKNEITNRIQNEIQNLGDLQQLMTQEENSQKGPDEDAGTQADSRGNDGVSNAGNQSTETGNDASGGQDSSSASGAGTNSQGSSNQ